MDNLYKALESAIASKNGTPLYLLHYLFLISVDAWNPPARKVKNDMSNGLKNTC
jgi:hypothetical protein